MRFGLWWGIKDKKRKSLAVACPGHSRHPKNYLLKGGQRAIDKDLQDGWIAYKDNTISVSSGMRHVGEGYRMAQDLVTANEALAKELLRQKTDQKTVIRPLPIFGCSVRERLCTMQERARFEQDLQTLTNDLSTKAEEEVITARDL